MPIPADYEERVYAGILGKIIGVYLGRPFEGWAHKRIEQELGEVDRYVHERLGKPLIVADDDISGTFTFIRALEDHGISPDLAAEQIGQTWFNYLIQERTILWWGGMGTSTEHTAYLRLKHGVPAPLSGSIERNGQVVAEQIGAQIFIDSWAMVAPGEPELAAKLARAAASVSHDGEAIYGAQLLAAMEAAAFFDSDMNSLLETGLQQIPADSLITRMVGDIRDWHAADGDWRRTFARIETDYGYELYGGGCHMIPNHAVIILALLYGDGDFRRSLMIANTAGWDTDCNSGNVGCLLGLRGGLQAIEADGAVDWRGPVADRMYNISADGGDACTDAVRETYRLTSMGRDLLGVPTQPAPAARFHFELAGSVQGFGAGSGTVRLRNVTGHSTAGSRALAIEFKVAPTEPAVARVNVFATPAELEQPGYSMTLSSALYPGQTVQAEVALDRATHHTVEIALQVEVYPTRPGAAPTSRVSPPQMLAPGERAQLTWRVPDTDGLPILSAGLHISGSSGGTAYLDTMTWTGAPDCDLLGAGLSGHDTPIGWTDGVDRTRVSPDGTQLTLIHDEGRGLLINGTRGWRDYGLAAQVSPHMAAEAGIAVRVGGMRRFIALLLCPSGVVRLLQCEHGDTIVQEAHLPHEPGTWSQLELRVQGPRLNASVGGVELFQVNDAPVRGGGVALITTEGRAFFRDVRVASLDEETHQ